MLWIQHSALATPTITHLAHQMLPSNSTVTPYFNEKNKHMEDHRWFYKIQELQCLLNQGKQDHTLAEDLYKQLITASIHAGSTLKKFPPAPYSPDIARL